ncbi:F-box/FBD/LRR-repeat protein At3g14710-like [Lotus japonicus]|uniref:F-box/FBD/LRR-repeat protein At3g14710-like n=1 Tax=Lotus japonicus TaxID=34305 RepID=UPI002582DF03|nr:F-box/FBD/LRR-repeat protein At3g14710-like [Lotus japonicus]
MEARKRRKSNKGQDMISDLPDFITGRILSFLPTRDAVRTSVLSKSWKRRWTFITVLHFEDRHSKKIRKTFFMNFVYMVLLRLNSSNIQSFSLAISDKYEPYHVDQWIFAVLSRRVKKLCVNSEKKQQTLFSHSIMRYKSLEELVLNVNWNIKVPTFACFSFLTVLNMSGIKFQNDPSNSSGKIHLDFPVLTTYETENCTWPSTVKCVTLKVPLLKMVSIRDFQGWSPYDADTYPVIKFCASCLTKFTYKGYLFPYTIVFDLSVAAIASAIIDICRYQYVEENVQEAVALSSKLLKQLKNVKSLEFKWSKKVLPFAKDSPEDLSTFEKLSHLELEEVTDQILLAFLHKTPILKTLILKGLLQVDQELLNYDLVHDCFLTTLQVVKFWSFDGSKHQLNFAKFVMANGVALKRMSFISTWELRKFNLEEVKEKLFSFKKCDYHGFVL